MKTNTARHWLLARHESSVPQLDTIRREALAAAPRAPGGFSPLAISLFGVGALAAGLALSILLRSLSAPPSSTPSVSPPAMAASAAETPKDVSQAATATALAPMDQRIVTRTPREAGNTNSERPDVMAAAPANDRVPPADSPTKLRDKMMEVDQRLAALTAQAARAAGMRGLAIVTGQVGKPGNVILGPADGATATPPANPSMSLAEAINAAGGLTEVGNGAAITVTRTLADGTTQTFGPLNLGTDQGKNFRVQPGDRINVPMRLF